MISRWGLSCDMIETLKISSPERLFKEKGPFFHVCSKPVDNILFGIDQDRKAALIFLALSAEESSMTILAYAIMSNHFHVILAGNTPERFYVLFKERVNQYLARHGHGGCSLPDEPTTVPVTSLNQLMDEIAYVIRNQYVVDRSVNPLSHLWSSGYLYFNPMLEMLASEVRYKPAAEMSERKIMQLTFSKNTTVPLGRILVFNGIPAPSSFVDYKLVERLFTDARLFTTKVFKNVEGQIETARLLGETPVFTDEEMSRLMWKYCKEEFGVNSIKQLTMAQKVELAKHMKYSYHSSNGQIARITLLFRREVDSLFPLSSK